MSSGWIFHREQGIGKQAPSASSDFPLFDQEPLIIDITDNWLIDGKRGRRPCSHSTVNPVPRAYARALSAPPLQGARNIHPRTDARGFLWYGVISRPVRKNMLIDAHAHLDHYGDELESVLMEITQHEIFTISNSMDPSSYRRNLEIAEKCRLVLPTFGIHPRRAPEYADHLAELGTAVEQSPILGEIGLDHHWVEDRSQYPAQQQVLEFFLTAAKEQNKIVNLHTKGAERNVLDLLVQHDIQRAIVHWYSGPLEILRAMVDWGCTFTVGVEVLYSEHIRAIVRELPMTQVLTETDNPGGQKWLNGTVGMPQLVHRVIHMIAELKEMNPKVVIRTIETNFARLILNDPSLPKATQDLFTSSPTRHNLKEAEKDDFSYQ